MNREQILQRLKEVQQKNGYLLHPKYGTGKMSLESWSKLIESIQRCPCDRNRPMCPCEQVEEEVERRGHCECKLFWQADCKERDEWA